MVQLSSPKAEIIPIKAGDKKVRTVNRVGQNDKPDFSRTLEKQKSAEKKDAPQGSIKHSKTEQPKPSQTENSPTKELTAKSAKHGKGKISEDARAAFTGALKVSDQKEENPVIGKKASRKNKNLFQDSSDSVMRVVSQQASDAGMKKLPSKLNNAASDSSENGEHASRGVISGDSQVKTDQTPVDESIVKEMISSDSTAETAEAAGNGTTIQSLSLDGEEKEQAGKKKTSLHRNASKLSSSDKVVSVEDRRTVKTEGAKAVFSPAKEQGEEGLTLEMASVEEIDGTAAGTEVRNSSVQFSLDTAEEQKGSFLLNKQLQEGGAKDLAKNIRFVLKDRNQGEIKLILKPEALGKVRIQLNLQENNIVGKIFVENNSVKQVFMNNLANLTKALEDSGFQTTSLDVQVGGGETGSHDRRHQESPVFFQRDAAELEDSIPVVFDNASTLSQIDLVI